MRLSLALAGVGAFALNTHAQPVSNRTAAPTANVKNGTYYGYHDTNYNQDVFLGVPYAQPPTGDLRFRVAQPLNSTWQGLRNATEFGYECVGYGTDTESLGNIVSEDCLTLNIVRPSGYKNESLPVAMWIHGGSFATGGSRDPRYNMTFMIQEAVSAGNPMIGIGINYRLAGWGFLFSEEMKSEGTGNLGLRDQRTAMHWIQENIAAFGGDPTKVTIWGESAGATSVGMHLVAYNGRDDNLYRAAIAESGGPIPWSAYANISSSQAVFDEVSADVGCLNSTYVLGCLRTVPYETMNTVLNATFQNYGDGATLIPIIDGDFLTQPASLQLAAGNFTKVPFLIGTNSDEGCSFGTLGINTDEQFEEFVRTYTNNSEAVSTLSDLYPDILQDGIPATLNATSASEIPWYLGSQYKRQAALAGDENNIAWRRAVNQAWAQNNVSSYAYRFNVLVNGMPWWSGAAHFQEVAFVFYNLMGHGYPANGSPNPFAGEPSSYSDLARLMTRMWSAFVATGDPNNSGVSAANWPVYTLDNPQDFVFDANITSYVEQDNFRAEGIAYMIENAYEIFGR